MLSDFFSPQMERPSFWHHNLPSSSDESKNVKFGKHNKGTTKVSKKHQNPFAHFLNEIFIEN